MAGKMNKLERDLRLAALEAQLKVVFAAFVSSASAGNFSRLNALMNEYQDIQMNTSNDASSIIMDDGALLIRNKGK